MESNASMHRVGIVLGIVFIEAALEMDISQALGFTKSDAPTVLDIAAPTFKGVGEWISEHFNTRANRSESLCKIPRLWDVSRKGLGGAAETQCHSGRNENGVSFR